MDNTVSRLTIPMDKDLRVKLGKRADDLGFDSPQALLRYVSKAVVDGREVTFGMDYGAPRDSNGWDDWGPVPEHVLKRWAEQKNDGKSFDNLEDFLADLQSYASKADKK